MDELKCRERERNLKTPGRNRERERERLKGDARHKNAYFN